MRKNNRSKKKPNNNAWFVRVRGSYLPANNAGLAIYSAYAAYVVAVFVSWLMAGHNYKAFLLFALPLVVAAALATQYIASRHTR